MSTDRELLEAAAKAAGYWCAEFNCPDRVPVNWNPLDDDGDALRLAVQLRLVVEIGRDATLVYQDDPGICELHESDPAAATRRAIVRAAAAMAGQHPAHVR